MCVCVWGGGDRETDKQTDMVLRPSQRADWVHQSPSERDKEVVGDGGWGEVAIKTKGRVWWWGGGG